MEFLISWKIWSLKDIIRTVKLVSYGLGRFIFHKLLEAEKDLNIPFILKGTAIPTVLYTLTKMIQGYIFKMVNFLGNNQEIFAFFKEIVTLHTGRKMCYYYFIYEIMEYKTIKNNYFRLGYCFSRYKEWDKEILAKLPPSNAGATQK